MGIFRTPSLKKSISAMTTGRLKRTVKKAIIPGYGQKGMGWITNPKRALYNKIYHATTIDTTNLIAGAVIGATAGVTSNKQVVFTKGNTKQVVFGNKKKKQVVFASREEIARQQELKRQQESMPICSNCKKHIDPDCETCPYCGVSFVEYEEVEVGTCCDCKKEVPTNSKFCPYCGIQFTGIKRE